MSNSTNQRMKIGDFLLRRLKEAGVQHLFGVPGDYNLELLQQLQDTGALQWVGNCSELNASYAADGYARLNGLGALLVTNGVGALSAINGVGGSYSDHERLRSCVVAITARLSAAASPAILVDADADRFGVASDLIVLARKIQAP